MPQQPRQVAHSFAKRLLWLGLCVLGGLVVGIIGQALSGSEVWFLAIPAAIAGGWLVFGTPTECVAPGTEATKPAAPHEAP